MTLCTTPNYVKHLRALVNDDDDKDQIAKRKKHQIN